MTRISTDSSAFFTVSVTSLGRLRSFRKKACSSVRFALSDTPANTAIGVDSDAGEIAAELVDGCAAGVSCLGTSLLSVVGGASAVACVPGLAGSAVSEDTAVQGASEAGRDKSVSGRFTDSVALRRLRLDSSCIDGVCVVLPLRGSPTRASGSCNSGQNSLVSYPLT